MFLVCPLFIIFVSLVHSFFSFHSIREKGIRKMENAPPLITLRGIIDNDIYLTDDGDSGNEDDIPFYFSVLLWIGMCVCVLACVLSVTACVLSITVRVLSITVCVSVKLLNMSV